MGKNNKGRIDDIIDIAAVEAQKNKLMAMLEGINGQFVAAAKNIDKMNAALKDATGADAITSAITKQGKALSDTNKIITEHDMINKELIKTEEKLLAAEKERAKAQKDAEKVAADAAKAAQKAANDAAKAIEKKAAAEKKASDITAQAAAKEKEFNDALKLSVKSISDAERQNKALVTVRKQLDLTTDAGKAKLKEYNSALTNNTEFIRANGTAADKQRMNIGNYKSAIMGVVGALGITGGLAGALTLAKGIMNATDAGADELERTMSGLKESALFFGRAISTMNFKNLIQGLKDANTEGRRYAGALDLIGDLQRSLGLQKQDIEMQISQQRIIAKNRRLDLADRQAAIKEIIRLEELKLTTTKAVTSKGVDNELTNAKFKSKVNKDEISDLISNYGKYVSTIEAGNKLIADIKKKTTTVTQPKQQGGATVVGGAVTIIDEGKKLEIMRSLNAEQMKSLRFAAIDATLTEDKRDLIAAALSADKQANQEMLDGKETLIWMENRLYTELITGEKKEEAANTKALKVLADKKDAYELLAQKVSDLNQQQRVLLAQGKAVPEELKISTIEAESKLRMIDAQIKGVFETLTGATDTSFAARGASIKPREEKTGLAAYFGGKPTKDTETQESKDLADKKKNEKDAAIDIANSIASSSIDIWKNAQAAEFDSKIAHLNKLRDAELANKNLTEAQKEAINKKYAKKEAALKREQAVKQKAADIMQAIVNTALAIIKALGGPPLLAQGLAIAAGVVGAAQIAVIAAQKIPQYFRGRTGGPAEMALVGEQGAEAIRYASGKTYITPSVPTLTYLPEGADVLTHSQLLNNIGLMSMPRLPEKAPNKPGMEDLRKDIHSGFAMLAHVVEGKTEHHVNITERGIWHATKNGEAYQKWLNDNIRY